MTDTKIGIPPSGEMDVLNSQIAEHWSPEQKNKIINQKIDIVGRKYKNEWKSCCMVLDRRAVQYFTQLAVIAGTMAFSLYQLINLPNCEEQQAYLGLLTLLIGLIIPNPKFHDNNT
jgi:hypothetical protein